MKGRIGMIDCFRRAALAIAIGALCNVHSDKLYADDIVSSELRGLAQDLDVGSLHRMQVFWLRDTVATYVGITPELFDKMVDDQVTAQMIIPHCDFTLSGTVSASLGHIFERTAETAVKGQPREVHWRLRFYGTDESAKYTVYMGTTYNNARDVSIAVGSGVVFVNRDVEEWFEQHLDLKECVIRP
jgi:hypothetical protein